MIDVSPPFEALLRVREALQEIVKYKLTITATDLTYVRGFDPEELKQRCENPAQAARFGLCLLAHRYLSCQEGRDRERLFLDLYHLSMAIDQHVCRLKWVQHECRPGNDTEPAGG